ncbi:HyaD/HybD family hydrogenase maturation endopeptidase [Amphritea sp.]|uniref:HyaD/HybD family hydrogenase maturation endopeptidase n=1 Tax=Amphritea sp. TaxID=1872502 RepID=UPI003D0E2ADF
MSESLSRTESELRVMILGIGNLLWADEGFGIRVVETLHEHYRFPANVELMDGGTQGIYLVQHVQRCDLLLVFDAIDYGLEPGAMKVIHGDDVPKFMGAKKMSLHQTGFQEVLAMAEFTGDYPQHLLLIGVQPVELEDFGGSLRPAVQAQVDPAIRIALDYLDSFGIHPQKRDQPLPLQEQLAPSELQQRRYEEGRPSEDDACRRGDERFLNQTAVKESGN